MKFFPLFALVLSTLALSAQDLSWHGFQRINFSIDSTPAYIVEPQTPLPGSPWIWRSSPPELHSTVDSILIGRGFHIAYLDYKGRYGQPALMQLWDKFYEYLIKEKKLSPKPALEGAAGGSLCEFAWAKRNPGKISCIYAENPVADSKSWPAGKLKGSGDAGQWKQLQEISDFTEEQALAFQDNPKDNLEGLASFKVPLYLSFGLHDAVVPMEVNSMVIASNYTKLGGPVTMHPMTRGAQEKDGHQITIENHCCPVKNTICFLFTIATRLEVIYCLFLFCQALGCK